MQGCSKFLIGDFVVLPTHNKIVNFDQEFNVEPKIMEVLYFFLQHPNEVLSKQQIIDALWPNQTINHDVITRAVFELRKIFQDNAKAPRFISTVNRKGYCFIHAIALDVPGVSNSSGVTRDKKISTLVSWKVLTACLLGLLFIIVITWPIDEPLIPANVSLLASEHKNVYQPALSPSGKEYIYVAQDNKKYSIIKASLADRQKQIIVTSEHRLVSPVWATPQQIVFARCEVSFCNTVTFDLLTATETILKHPPNNALQSNVVNLDISNEQGFVVSENTSEASRQVVLFTLDNDELKLLSRIDDASLPTLDKYLKKLYYVSFSEKGHQELFQYDIDTDKRKAFNIAFDRIFSLEYNADGFLWLSGRRDGESGIWLYEVSTNSLTKVIDAPPGYVLTELAFNAVTKQLVYKSVKRNINISVAGFEYDMSSVNSNMIDMNAVYADKRKQLFFASNRTGFYELWTHKHGEVKKLTRLKANVINRPVISNSQSKLAFTSVTLNETYLRIIDVDNDEIIDTYKMPYNGHLLSWGKEEDTVYFSAEVNSQYTIFQFNLKNQKTTAVALNAGVLYFIDDNNHEFYGNMQSAQLMKRTSDGEVESLFQLPYSAIPIMPHQAKVMNGKFYYADNAKGRKEIKVNLLDGVESKKQFSLPQNAYVTQLGSSEKPFVIYDQLVIDEKQLVLTAF